MLREPDTGKVLYIAAKSSAVHSASGCDRILVAMPPADLFTTDVTGKDVWFVSFLGIPEP